MPSLPNADSTAGKPGAVAISGRVLASLNPLSTRGNRKIFFRWKKKLLRRGFEARNPLPMRRLKFYFFG